MDDQNILENDNEPDRKKRSWWRGWLLVLGTALVIGVLLNFGKLLEHPVLFIVAAIVSLLLWLVIEFVLSSVSNLVDRFVWWVFGEDRDKKDR